MVLPEKGSSFAAIDLGSNSFHLVIGREAQGEILLVDRLREPVRLAGGLDENGHLDRKTVARALECLRRFGERLRGIPAAHVRAVGTNTLRRAREEHFLSQARRALGVPIEVLPGAEEARLIYLGASSDVPQEGRRLVLDIGGGSTECILGEGREPRYTDSLYMGCVSYTRAFFPKGRLTREAFKKAELAAGLELEPIVERYREQGWMECVGCSGTIKAVGQIAASAGWSEDQAVTSAVVRKVRKALIQAGSVRRIDLAGMQEDRAPVFAGGVAILKALFDNLEIEALKVSGAALREGLLYDLVGRVRHEDVRQRTIDAMSRRYHVDPEQALRVNTTAQALLAPLLEPWSLDPETAPSLVAWAASLHELGLVVSYSGYHKHGEYLLANSDMPGFSREEQGLLATLVRSHRRKFPPDTLEALPPFHRELAFYLGVVLRLAVRLNRARGSEAPPTPGVSWREGSLSLEFAEGWLNAHPLARADLEEEAVILRKAGIQLSAG